MLIKIARYHGHMTCPCGNSLPCIADGETTCECGKVYTWEGFLVDQIQKPEKKFEDCSDRNDVKFGKLKTYPASE